MNRRRGVNFVDEQLQQRQQQQQEQHAFVPAAIIVDAKPDIYPINAKICQLVEKFPCMYDRTHPQYLRNEAVGKAWMKIAKEMNESIPSCKERWRNIRTSFARSINVYNTPATANRTKPYYLHTELQFLIKHITPGMRAQRRSNNGKKTHAQGQQCLDTVENIKLELCEDTYDSFAAAYANEPTDVQDVGGQQQQRQQVTPSSTGLPSEQDTTTYDDENDVTTKTNSTVNAQGRYKKTASLKNQNANNTNTNATEVTPMVQPVHPYPPKKRTYPVMQSYESHVDNNNQANQQECNNSSYYYSNIMAIADFDDAFLQGLRPEMKVMNFQQKLYFKRRIYELLGEIFPHTNQVSNSSANTLSSASSTAQNNSSNDAPLLRRLNSVQQPVQPPKLVPNHSRTTAALTTANGAVLMLPRLRTTAAATTAINANTNCLNVHVIKEELSE